MSKIQLGVSLLIVSILGLIDAVCTTLAPTREQLLARLLACLVLAIGAVVSLFMATIDRNGK